MALSQGKGARKRVRWDQTCTDDYMHRRVGAPGKIHNIYFVCLECESCVRGDRNGVSWTYLLVQVFFKARLVPTKYR